MKTIMLTIRLKYFYLTYKGIKTIEVRKTAPKDFVGDVYEVVSKTKFEKDLMEIPENEREFFRQFKGKVGLKFTLKKVSAIHNFNEYVIFPENKVLGGLTLTELYNRHYILMGKEELEKATCLTANEILDYGGQYAWQISNLVIFDKPKELSEFIKPKWHCYRSGCPHFETPTCNKNKCKPKAPQSWCYVEEPYEN